MDSATFRAVRVPAGETATIDTRQVLPGYFQAMGQSPRSGRLIADDDFANRRPVVVLSEASQRLLFADETAVGRQLEIGREPHQVVGIVADVRQLGPRVPAGPTIYIPYRPTATSAPLTVVLRARGQTPPAAADLRRVAQSVGPRVVVERVRTGWDWLGDWVARPRQRAVLIGALSALAAAVALVGVFGVTAYAVARRTREIGVRIALGARPHQVVTGVVAELRWPIAGGVIAGIVAGLLVMRMIAAFLFQVAPTDPATFAGVGISVVVAAVLAAWVPARRAARVDPVVALRPE
jgi:predicted lysophospholipase L1 biosynthesis ABC-type transport system permease subunit